MVHGLIFGDIQVLKEKLQKLNKKINSMLYLWK